MQALPFAFLLFISLSIVETRRSSSRKGDEKEIVPTWPGGTTPVYVDKGIYNSGSIKEGDENGHEIRPMHPNTDDECEEEGNDNEIRPTDPSSTTPEYMEDECEEEGNDNEIRPMNPCSTTPEYTEDECEEEGNDNEIWPMNPSSTTPGYMRKGSTYGSVKNENYPTWPTSNTPGYMEKGSTRKKCVSKTTTTTTWPAVNTPGYMKKGSTRKKCVRKTTTTTTTWSTRTTPGYDEIGSTQGNAPDEKPPTKPPARTHGNKEKDCLQGYNGWSGYGGRGCGKGYNAGDKPPSGYSQGKNWPLGGIIVPSTGWPGYGGRDCSQGTSIELTRLRVTLRGWPGRVIGCGQENDRPLIRPPVSTPGSSGFGECGLTHGLGFGGSGCGQENKRPLIRLPISLPGFSGFGSCGLTHGLTGLGFGSFLGFQFNFGRSPFSGC
ncbi:hypothetical protein V3C99_013454 [Haemonchus contortus]